MLERGAHALQRVWLLGALATLTACGGAVPLLHPAHALAPGQVAGALGLSSTQLLGAAEDARRATADGAAVPSTVADAAVADAAVAPAIAPFVGARAGVAPNVEAGLAYTGRALRVDGRYVVRNGALAASAGLGASGVLVQATRTATATDVDVSAVRGYGVDVPLLVGYRSTASVLEAWGGARLAYQRYEGTVGLPNVGAAALDAHRWSAGAVLGAAAGLAPIWVALELAVSHETLTGTVAPDGAEKSEPRLSGFVLAPAAAIRTTF